MKGKQFIRLGIAVLLVSILGVLLYQNWTGNQLQRAFLEELDQNSGNYDPTSIVLHNTSKAKAEQLAELLGARLRITEDGSFAAMYLPDSMTIRDVVEEDKYQAILSQLSIDYQIKVSELTDGEEEAGMRLPSRPVFSGSDEAYAQQHYLDYLNMGNVWESYTGKGVKVAIIDTGIDTDHPEFAGRISKYSYNATEDKIVKDCVLADGSLDWSLVEDQVGHGTAVAGILAASMNGDGIVGIAPDVEIIVIKAECDANGNFARTSDLVFALYYAIERDVHVVNMSFGVAQNYFAGATQLAYDSDIICVASAGNLGTAVPNYPAADPLVIGVGALESGSWLLAEYSSYGDNVNVVAPGAVYTAALGGGYEAKIGTSMSAPQVAGAVALFMQTNPYATFEDVTEILYASSHDLGGLGRDWYYGFGSLDMHAFLLEERGTVTFEMLTDELENEKGVFIRNHTMQELPEPERLYVVFDGWYYDDMFTQECAYYSDAFDGDLTLYAKWVNEDDGIPYTYVILDDGTVEIRSYTGHRRYITVPEKIEGKVVSSIGDNAFAGQTRLREIILPDGLTNIGENAFAGCSNLVTMHIPANVTKIGNYGFADNVRLHTISFSGSQLAEIGAFAFSGCGALEQIELPSGVESLDGRAFYGATGMQRITVQSGNKTFVSRDGVLYTADGTRVVAYPAGREGAYTLPENCLEIGEYAFAFAKISDIDLRFVSRIREGAFIFSSLETLVIPDSVTGVETKVFAHNGRLTQVQIGQGLPNISADLFAGCSTLRNIHIPAGIGSIDSRAFQGSGLNSVTFDQDSQLKTIGADAFNGCAIGTISIPDSVLTIDDRAFMGNPLTDVTLPGNLTTIGELAFAYTALATLDVPKSVTNLGAGAFAYCQQLSRITVESGNGAYHDIQGVVYTLDNTLLHTYPAGKTDNTYTMEAVTTGIGSYAFSATANLDTVYLSDVLVDIHEYAFDESGIDSIAIPDSVTRLGRYAFTNCLDLTAVSFHPTSGLSRIGYGAFVKCGLTSFTVPANVSTMGQQVFLDCDTLTAVTFAENSRLESLSAYIFSGCSNLQSIIFLPGSALTSVQAHGLEGMDKLTSIDFGDAAVTNIDNFAFRFCTSLRTLKLPETVTNIGRYAFYCCENLSELMLPENVEHIGSYAFLGTGDLQLYLAATHMPKTLDEDWDRGIAGYYVGVTKVSTSGDYKYAKLSSGGIAILEYLGSADHVDLRAVNLGGSITAIGGKAFRNSTITSVILPDTLTEIQAEAFAYSRLTGITIPAAVTFIGREAFAGTDIAELTFAAGANVQTIEQKAFADTENLTGVVIPAGVTKLGTGVFQNSGLTSVTFESGILLEEIPQKAFMGTKLETVALPDSVTLVNHNAFANVSALRSVTFGDNDGIRLMGNAFYHTGLTSLTIPANVTYIGEFCFVALENLNDFAVDANNPNYMAQDGLLLNKSGRKLIAVPAGRTGVLTVPSSVEEIGFGAFACSKLSEVKFAENANILTVGCRAFSEAENLTKITIPASVVSIDYYAFAYCENLQTVAFAKDNQLQGIYEGAFCGDIALENIELPATIVEISDFAFYGCSKLDRIPMEDTRAVKGIYDYAFAYTGLSGDLTTPENLLDIGSYAFLGTNVESVTVPDTKQKELVIGLGAFEDCDNLTQITLPFIGASFENEEITWFSYIFGAGNYSNKDTVGDVMDVYVPDSLKTVTITEGIHFIGTGGFSNCVGLETIHIPGSVNTLYPDAFRNTTATHTFGGPIAIYDPSGQRVLEEGYFGNGITGSLQLKEGITTIGFHAFEGCRKLESLVLPNGVKTIKSSAFYACSNLREVVFPDSLQTIESMAFYGCRALRRIELPAGLKTIESYMFTYCPSLADVQIPESVTSIGESAFYCCTGLNQITLPKNLTQISSDAFEGCTNLFDVKNESALELQIGSTEHGQVAYFAKKLTDRQGNVSYLDENAGFAYVETPEGFRFLLENGQYKLVAYVGDEQTITLPESVNGNPYQLYYFTGATNVIIPEGTTQIDDYAFYNAGSLKSVVIPGSVKKIGNYAFRNTTGLTEIVIPEGVESIGTEAFCSASLSKVRLPNTLRSIGASAFSATDLRSITIPDGVTELGSRAFDNCMDLRSVTLSESLTTLPGEVFRWCEQLEHVEIPAGVKGIEMSAFRGCTNLRSIVLCKGLKTIGSGAFAECAALETVALPDTLVTIGSNAFRGCSALKELYIPVTVTSIGGGAFDRALMVQIAPGNSSFTMIDGILYNKQVTTMIQVTEAIPKNVVIPDGVTSVPDYAFAECDKLESIYLPDSVRSIGEYAFQNCVKLSQIEMSDSLTSISGYAFLGCRNLSAITIPDGVAHMGSGVFSGCSALKEIKLPEKMTSISQSLFFGCRSLMHVDIPDGITEIDHGAFAECSALTEIRIPAGVTRIDYYSFAHCEKLFVVHNNSDLVFDFGSQDYGDVAYHAKMIVDKDGTVRYGDKASGFELFDTEDGFRIMKENGQYTLLGYVGDASVITLPDSIEGQSYTLRMFFGGEHIVLPENMTEIPDSAFTCNGAVKQVTLPEGLVKIGNHAFSHCCNLQTITIPGKVREIGNSAFYNCGLEQISIPDSVTSLGDRCFEASKNLRQLALPDGLEYVGCRMVYDTGISNEEGNWNSGGLMLNGYLLAVKDDAIYLDYSDSLRSVANDVYSNTKQLKNAFYCSDLDGAANVETMIVLEYAGMPEPPITLKNVVLTERVTSSDLYANPYFFQYMDGVTIFVEEQEQDLRWDQNFPGWNNGNKVIYGDGWIWVKFYAEDGTLLLCEPKRSSEVIHRPVITGENAGETYELIGWDLDGDGEPDTVPATSATDIEAVAICSRSQKMYTITFKDAESGEIYLQERLAHGDAIRAPEDPVKEGKLFEGWNGYTEGMTATGDMEFTARWHTHGYQAVVKEPTCTEKGYTTYTCSACGDSYVSNYTDTVDHSYENGSCIWCGQKRNYVKWISGTTSLNGTIDLNIYVALSDDILHNPNAYVRFIHSGVTVDVPVSEGLQSEKNGIVCYRYSCEIFAKQVADKVTVQVMTENGAVGKALNYSVMQYCANQIKNSKDEKLVTVCKTLLNYAAAAQTLFNYNTTNMANASLSDADKVLQDVDASKYKYSITGKEPGIRASSATLMLESEVKIRVYFQLTGDKSIEDYTFTIDGKKVDVKQNDKGYYIESDGIPAKALDDMHKFCVGGITVNYGALSYVNSKVSSSKTAEDDRNLAKALYAYYAAAEALLG